jgi:hypothetical protein
MKGRLTYDRMRGANAEYAARLDRENSPISYSLTTAVSNEKEFNSYALFGIADERVVPRCVTWYLRSQSSRRWVPKH